MGMAGAAWATVIAWIVGSLIILTYYKSPKNLIRTKLADYKVNFVRLKEMLLIGVPSLARQVAASGVAILVNNVLKIHGGGIAIAAYGVINRTLMVFFMPMFGIVQGMQPILGYNHGAGFHHRVKEVSLLATKILTYISIGIFILCMAIPRFLLGIFSDDLSLLGMAVPAMRIITLIFPFV